MASARDRIRGFYAVLDQQDRALAELLAAEASVVQVRLKPADPIPLGEVLACARMAREVTRAAGALLIVNDRLDVAAAVGADGVHLGQDDLPLAEARELRARLGLGDDFLIGISTHDLAQVEAAVGGGAGYLGFGPVFATATKAHPDPVVGVAGLAAAAAAAAPVPVVGIGGITPETAASVAAAGAAAACAIASVNRVPSAAAAARAIAAAWA